MTTGKRKPEQDGVYSTIKKLKPTTIAEAPSQTDLRVPPVDLLNHQDVQAPKVPLQNRAERAGVSQDPETNTEGPESNGTLMTNGGVSAKPAATSNAPSEPEVRVHPVDCFNRHFVEVQNPLGEVASENSYVCPARPARGKVVGPGYSTGDDMQAYLKDRDGVIFALLKVGQRFTKIDWEMKQRHERTQSTSQGGCRDGWPLSPGSAPHFGELSDVELERLHHWEEEQGRNAPDWLDPDSMIAFYPGIVTMYGTWQVP